MAKLGYGTDLATVFTGELDEINLEAQPRDYLLNADCRDLACWLIDQTIKLNIGNEIKYYIEYPLPAGVTKFWLTPGATNHPDIADIVKDLCLRAGFAAADVVVEATGIQLNPKFERLSYMDAINELCTASGFEFFVDEDGKARFYYPTDRSPEITNKSVVLSGTGWVLLGQEHLVAGSDRVTGSGGTVKYVRGTDYDLDLVGGKIRRLPSGSIPNGGTVAVSYIYAGWVFREGEDIFSLSLSLSRRNLYGTIRVAGEGAEGVAVTSSPLWDTCKVQGDKVLFADNSYLDSKAKCQACADRLQQDMLRRYVCASFVAVGNPWLQVGDNIMVVESSSTISEVYKILSLSYDLSPDGFIMTLRVFHVGYTPLTTA